MRVPDDLPFELAFLNALHGVPCFGVFAPFPCPAAEVDAWARLVPWALHALGPWADRSILVLPPTPPGVAFLLDRLGASVMFAGEVPLPLLTAFQARVVRVVAEDLPARCVAGVLALSVHPPSEEIEMAQRLADRVLMPGGVRAVGWRGEDGLELMST